MNKLIINKSVYQLMFLAIALLIQPIAQAKNYSTERFNTEHNDRHYDRYDAKAKVIKVKPIYKTIRKNTPSTHCYKEKVIDDEFSYSDDGFDDVYEYNNYSHNERSQNFDDNAVGMVIGGLIGGATGHRFGKGNGKDVATVVGSVIGAVVGNNIAKNNQHRRTHNKSKQGRNKHVTYETQCDTIDNYTETRKIVGYKVKYVYQGHTFWTKTKHHPGRYLSVKVKLHPVI